MNKSSFVDSPELHKQIYVYSIKNYYTLISTELIHR